MRWIKWALAVSLLFNVLAIGGYAFGLHALHREGWSAAALDLDPAQRARLEAMRKEARAAIKSSRHGLSPRIKALAETMRAARPGADQLEPALRQLSDAHLATRLDLLRRAVVFRDSLDPARRERFNRLLDRPSFLFDLLGFSLAAEVLRAGLAAPPQTPDSPITHPEIHHEDH